MTITYTIIALCNKTMNIADPWLEAGYQVVMVDPQHPPGVTTLMDGQLVLVGCVITEAMDVLAPIVRSGRVAGVFGFPPCTDVALSGTRWWSAKRAKDPYFQAKAAMVAEQCRMIGMLAGGFWAFENPMSVFSRMFGTPQHKFQPFHFTALCGEDNYTKETWLWTGGGFVMPEPAIDWRVQDAITTVRICTGKFLPKPAVLAMPWNGDIAAKLKAWYPDDRIHKAGPSDDRGNIRSATPRGFARAVFKANDRRSPENMAVAA